MIQDQNSASAKEVEALRNKVNTLETTVLELTEQILRIAKNQSELTNNVKRIVDLL